AAEPAARHLATLEVIGAGVSAYCAEVVVLPSTTELGEAEQSDAPPVRVGSAWFQRLLHMGLLCRIAQFSSRRRQRSLRVGICPRGALLDDPPRRRRIPAHEAKPP